MKWYVTQLIYEICNSSTATQFDEQIRMINAENRIQAQQKLLALGKSLEEKFENINGKTVTWRLFGTTILEELSEVNDGLKVYSTTHESDHNYSVIKYQIGQKQKLNEYILVD